MTPGELCRCRFCRSPFEYQPRPFSDVVQLRAILLIPDSVPEPIMVCDICFERSVTAFNPEATNVGTRNDGPNNLVLRHMNG
jgi:hypothetical protein